MSRSLCRRLPGAPRPGRALQEARVGAVGPGSRRGRGRIPELAGVPWTVPGVAGTLPGAAGIGPGVARVLVGVAGIGPGVALLLAALLGCQTRYAPEPAPVSAASVSRALQVVGGEAARREDLDLVEDGLVLDAWFYRWKERVVWEDPGDPFLGTDRAWGDGFPGRTERVRVLEGPRRVYAPFGELRGVAVRSWALGAGVELVLAGEPEPAFLRTEDREAAERLGAALELLRRARGGGGAPGPAGEARPRSR